MSSKEGHVMDVHVNDSRSIMVAPDRLVGAASVARLLVHFHADSRSRGNGAEPCSRSSSSVASNILRI